VTKRVRQKATVTEIVIRDEGPRDAASVREVSRAAFETAVKAEIVDLLRETCAERISLVALYGADIVGHLLQLPAPFATGPSSAAPCEIGFGLGNGQPGAL
jgi:predicted N-acetyltransferase YhbS